MQADRLTCKVCGKEFVPYRKNQTICSSFCRNNVRQADPEYYERRDAAAKVEAEIAVDRARMEQKRKRKMSERMKREAYLAARDAEYAREFPDLVGGQMRGRNAGGRFRANSFSDIYRRFQ